MSEAQCRLICVMWTPSPSRGAPPGFKEGKGREGREKEGRAGSRGRVRFGGSRSGLSLWGKEGGDFHLKRGDGGGERKYGISAVDRSAFELGR
jgi:hypothetical protein